MEEKENSTHSRENKKRGGAVEGGGEVRKGGRGFTKNIANHRCNGDWGPAEKKKGGKPIRREIRSLCHFGGPCEKEWERSANKRH